jgi:D-proline reductase (dithiol) PrdB
MALWAGFVLRPKATGSGGNIAYRYEAAAELDFKTFKDQILAKVFTRFPSLFRRWVRNHQFVEFNDPPWTPFAGPIERCRVALVTTAGVHLKSDRPFDMRDPAGDPSFRIVPADPAPGQWSITHNYYDHADADQDLNVVLPLERLRELAGLGEIGAVNARHFSFMGHILPPHIRTLMQVTAPQVADLLKQDRVDAVLLTPA